MMPLGSIGGAQLRRTVDVVSGMHDTFCGGSDGAASWEKINVRCRYFIKLCLMRSKYYDTPTIHTLT